MDLAPPPALPVEAPARQVLRLQPLAAATFARYGGLIDADGPPGAGRLINQGSSRRFDGFGALVLDREGGVPCLAVFRAAAQAPAGPWQLMERHRLGSQTFLPLGGARCIVLVALGHDAPDPATLAAFAVGPRQGFTLAPGTWHHGLIALDAGDFVVLERAAAAEDCELATLDPPVWIAPA